MELFDVLGNWGPSPACVRRDKRLKPTTRLVYVELLDHARILRGKWVVYPGVERIAELLDLSQATVKRAFKELVKYGLIDRSRRSGTSSLTILKPLSEVYPEEALYRPCAELQITDEPKIGSECDRKADVVEAEKEEADISPIKGMDYFFQKTKFRKAFPKLLAMWQAKNPGLDVLALCVQCNDHWFAEHGGTMPQSFSPGGRCSTWINNAATDFGRKKPAQQVKVYKPEEEPETMSPDEAQAKKAAFRKELDGEEAAPW